MQTITTDGGKHRHIEQSTGSFTTSRNPENMGKRERKLVLLEFLAEHGLALPPAALHRNMRLMENITFSQRSLEKYLNELATEGLVDRVRPEPLADRELETLDPESNKKAYYIITDEGVAIAANSSEY